MAVLAGASPRVNPPPGRPTPRAALACRGARLPRERASGRRRSRDASNRPVRAGTPHDARRGDGDAVAIPLAVDERDETVVRRRSRGFRMISARFLLDIARP